MKLVDLALEVRFNGKAVLIETNDLRQTLLKKIDPNAKTPTQLVTGISVQQADKRAIVIAEESRYGASVQDKNVKNAQKKIKSYVTTINSVINYSDLKVARVGIRTIWLQKYDDNIESLKQKYRHQFYSENNLVKHAIDFGVNLTLEAEGFTIGYISGPVRKDEPLAFVSFPVNDLNEANVYIAVDCFMVDQDKINVDKVLKLLGTAVAVGEEKAKQTLRVLGVTA